MRMQIAFLALKSEGALGMQVKEVIIVEGLHDRDRVLQAVSADVLVTGGSHIEKAVFDRIERVANDRGIIVLTDPDFAGNQIRRKITERFPQAKHAHIERGRAVKRGDIGVENATSQAIVEALQKVRTVWEQPDQVVSWSEMQQAGLVGLRQAAHRRERVGAILHIGYANAKTFHQRLNTLNVTHDEFKEAVARIEAEENQ